MDEEQYLCEVGWICLKTHRAPMSLIFFESDWNQMYQCQVIQRVDDQHVEVGIRRVEGHIANGDASQN